MLMVRMFCRFTSCLSFYSILNELNDYAGQREVVAEEMAHKVYGELMRYSQDLKTERKHVSTTPSLYLQITFDRETVSVCPFHPLCCPNII